MDKIFRRIKFSAPSQNFGSFVLRKCMSTECFPKTYLAVIRFPSCFLPSDVVEMKYFGQNFRHKAKFSALFSAEILSDKVTHQIFHMNLCCSPGYGGPGTFYGIEKSCCLAEIWIVKVGPYARDFGNLTVFV